MPKYLRLEMQPASGTVVAAGGGGVVEQVVRITNSMQVWKAFMTRRGRGLGTKGLEEGVSGGAGGVALTRSPPSFSPLRELVREACVCCCPCTLVNVRAVEGRRGGAGGGGGWLGVTLFVTLTVSFYVPQSLSLLPSPPPLPVFLPVSDPAPPPICLLLATLPCTLLPPPPAANPPSCVPQGQKNLLMKLKLVYEVGGAKMQEMASVSSFPPGY